MYDFKLFLALLAFGAVAACQQVEPIPHGHHIVDDSTVPGKY